MPAGQVYRLTRVQRQQQRQFDLNLLGLQLTDETALNTAPENPGTGYLRRYRGRQQWSQWPTLSRLDATGLELADQPAIDLEPWVPPTATYQRYRGRPAQAQWPTYARMQATDLQLVDETVLNTVPEYIAPWFRPTRGVQWRQYFPLVLPAAASLPDQDVNLVPVSARMWRPPSRANYQQAVYFDLGGLGLQLVDQDVNLVPVSARMWRPPSATQRRQFTPTDPSGLELADADQTLTFAPWSTGSAIYAIRKSRASWQQAVYFDLGGLGLQLADQDVTLRPVNAVPPRGVRSLAAQWHQQAFSDPAFLTPVLPDQDINLVTLWASSAAVYAIRKGHQQWQQYTPYDLSQIPVVQDVNLVPSWMAANTWIARRAGRPTWQQFAPTDPTALELPDQDITLVPSWPALMGGVLARRFGRAERLQPVYYDLAGLGLQLADQDVRLVPVSSPSSTFLRYRGRQAWYVRVFYPTTDAIPSGPVLLPPLFTLFATDGSMLTTATDAGIRVVVSIVDGRYVTQFASNGVAYTENLNP